MHEYLKFKEEYEKKYGAYNDLEEEVDKLKRKYHKAIAKHVTTHRLLDGTRWARYQYDSRVKLTKARVNQAFREFLKELPLYEEFLFTKDIYLEICCDIIISAKDGDELKKFLIKQGCSLTSASYSIKKEMSTTKGLITRYTEKLERLKGDLEVEQKDNEELADKARAKAKKELNKNKPWFDKE